MDPDSLVKLLIALFLVLLNGFFVAAEFSIVKVRYSQIQIKAAEGNTMAKQAESIIKNLDACLSATQLGITLASLALGWVGESALHHIIEGIFHSLDIELAQTTVTTISVVCSFLLITIMHIVFGELVPKSIAIRKSEATTLFIAYPLHLFYNIFRPFIWLMNSLSNGFLKIIKIHPVSEHDIHSTEELQLLVKQSADSGEIEEENYEIIKNAFDFTDHNAKQIMIPRQNISSINIQDDPEDIINQIMDSGYSRIPVYSETEYNIKGILYIKDLLPYIDKPDTFRWQSLIRPAYFVPETKKIDDLLEEFRTNKIHMAIVVDEFGGTSGIVTMEDILEEIVGEISDEYDEDEQQFIRLADGSLIFEAKILLTDFFRVIDADPSDFGKLTEEVETLAGLLLEIKGDFPRRREIIDFKEYRFQVLEVDNRRILKVKFNRIPEGTGNDENGKDTK